MKPSQQFFLFNIMSTGFLLLIFLNPSWVRANDSDLKEVRKFDHSEINHLEDTVDDAAVGNEIEAVQNDSYKAAAQQASSDKKKLKSELEEIRAQTAKTKAERAKLKNQTEQAFKELEVKNKQVTEAQRELAVAKKEKAFEDKRNQKVMAELAKLDSIKRSLAEDRRKIDTMTKLAIEERKEILQKISTQRENLINERKNQKNQITRYNQYRKQSHDLNKQSFAGR